MINRSVGLTRSLTSRRIPCSLLLRGFRKADQEPGQVQHVVKEHIVVADMQATASASGPTVPVQLSSVRQIDLRVSRVHELVTKKQHTSGFILLTRKIRPSEAH